ncbi:hypothetical protein SAMN05444487_10222 [Marininema mesophilum]|uniref:Uncharacterized protein n=1 Tax=Marininema mesophilum TaxID=1048340 RepID=A0A1H2RWY5_9BACL|nr:hypothetical protein [Marininema mesophilum]SDW23284.1 hypothetical protein SAMN05444487_10222 [Marininema mesophilum]
MYLHGIPFVHLKRHYPEITPQKETARRSPSHLADTHHLKECLGFVPVHLLRTSKKYPLDTCLKECLRYGDTVMAFSGIPTTCVQLSLHEWGVDRLMLRKAVWILTLRPSALRWLKVHFPSTPLILTGWDRDEKRRHRRLGFPLK